MDAGEPEQIYKITTADLFAAAQIAGVLGGMPVDVADGYMHFSTAAQLRETLRLHFKGQRGLALLAVRVADVRQALKWEPSRRGELFPHLYAPLKLSAVAWSAPVVVDASGECVLPDGIR